jgi:hypothetical protein
MPSIGQANLEVMIERGVDQVVLGVLARASPMSEASRLRARSSTSSPCATGGSCASITSGAGARRSPQPVSLKAQAGDDGGARRRLRFFPALPDSRLASSRKYDGEKTDQKIPIYHCGVQRKGELTAIK